MQQARAEAKEEGTEWCLMREDLHKQGEAVLQHSLPQESSSPLTHLPRAGRVLELNKL